MPASNSLSSLDHSGNGGLPQSDQPPASPTHSTDGNQLADNRPTTPSPISPVDPVQGEQDNPIPHQGRPQSARSNSNATPRVDDFGPTAVGGGISGIALGVANCHGRQSGIDAHQSLYGEESDRFMGPVERAYHTTGSDNPYIPMPPDFHAYASSDSLMARNSYGSYTVLGAGAGSASQTISGVSTPRLDYIDHSRRSLLDRQSYPYPILPHLNGGPYQRGSSYIETDATTINPDEIADDGEDGIPLSNSRKSYPSARADTKATAAGAGLGALGGIMGGSQSSGPSYGPVSSGGLESGEKSRWVQPKPSGKNRRRGWICGAVLAFIIVGAIVGGAVGGTIGNRENDKSQPTVRAARRHSGASIDSLSKDSAEIKDLINNVDLHKVFPGVNYTPLGVQYPLCHMYPPSQNNVTRDIAVISQLTNTIRLYGTDCGQVEMVLHAIDQLELKDMRLWLGVWIESNDTTNDRQLQQLYKIIDGVIDTSIFKGAIIGNEVLSRAGPDIDASREKLIGYLKDVRNEFKKRNVNLPVTTSDLGNNWSAELVAASDIVMSNIHPFFAGVTAGDAANWAYGILQSHEILLAQGTSTGKELIISEIGWPSSIGSECGNSVKSLDNKTDPAAGINEMNQFMSEWVCQSLENGTDFFWFEAFDESWRMQYNEPCGAWGNKWGLMDSTRRLKPGLKIPDCGGKTVS